MFLHKINVNNKRKGSIVLETAIVLPIFISVILSITLLIKIIYTHEVIQYAISQTANELAAYSYLYHLSGVEGIHNEMQQKIEEIPMEFEIPDEIKHIFHSIIKGAYNDTLSQLCIPIAKICLKKYLITDKIEDPDERLKTLDIVDGFEGLDFSMSGFFEGDNDNIHIVVRYKIDIPTPVKIFPLLTIIQKASVRGWLGGDEKNYAKKDDEKQEDIWSLDNFTRGKKIREIFGANLPFTFPVIARFDFASGTATMIKSMDLTLKSYQNPKILSRKIKLYIGNLQAYSGQEVPWGKNQIIIKNNNIIKKELILVIPNNEITSEIEFEIEQCVLYANNKNIHLNVKKYGHKIIKN